jgi:hypothetical protein
MAGIIHRSRIRENLTHEMTPHTWFNQHHQPELAIQKHCSPNMHQAHHTLHAYPHAFSTTLIQRRQFQHKHACIQACTAIAGMYMPAISSISSYSTCTVTIKLHAHAGLCYCLERPCSFISTAAQHPGQPHSVLLIHPAAMHSHCQSVCMKHHHR